MSNPEKVRRASEALQRAIQADEDDVAHIGYERLEALVDGTLDEADREVVEAHLALCRNCADDAADLEAMRQDIASESARRTASPVPAPVARTRAGVRWSWRAAAAMAAAALVLLAIWTGRPGVTPADSPVAGTTTPAPSVAPVIETAPPDPLAADERAVVQRIVERGRLELPAGLTGSTGALQTLLGAPRDVDGPTPVSPVNTAVLETRPMLRWRPLPGAATYTVAVFDDSFSEVARSERLTGTEWTVTRDLRRGAAYAWQITATVEGREVVGPAPPQPEARFRLLDEGAAGTARDRIARLADRPLALAVLLARAGLVADAVRLLERAANDPVDGAAARTLLADLRQR